MPRSHTILARIDQYLYDQRLESEMLLRKRWAWIWMMVTFVGSIFSVFLFLFVMNLWPLSWVGFAFLAGYVVALPLYRRSKRFDLVINLLFSYFIVVIFFAILQVGGIPSNLGYIFIGLNCAMGSVLAGNLRWTIFLFALYCATIVLTGILQPQLTTPDYVEEQTNTLAFVTLAVWINACILLLMVFFIKDHERFEKAETDRLKKLDSEKTRLYMNISHEFRTPLTVIQGIANQIESQPEKWTVKGPEKIKEQGRILLHLVNQMLDISKLETGNLQLKYIHGNIAEYVRYVANSFLGLAESQEIELRVSENTGSIHTDYDPDKLLQVLANLISNAIKFTPPGGLIRVEIKHLAQHTPETLEIVVTDSGKGISKDEMKRIFDRFYQVSDKNHETAGTGLGLAITKELVKLMNGEIHVQSEVGKGSRFIISLPVTAHAAQEMDPGISKFQPVDFPGDDSRHSHDENLQVPPNVAPDKPLLLIVEDNPEVAEYLASALEDTYSISIASNGREGLQKSKQIIPDIILTDIMMPVMDGFEMIRSLKAHVETDHIPIIIVTALGDVPSILEGLKIGADHYLVKPFNEKELLLRLKNVLAARLKMQYRAGILPSVQHQGSLEHRRKLEFFSKINNIINEHLEEEDFGIENIGSGLNMSKSQLYRKFSALTDLSIGKYVRSYRLHKAKEMMEKEGKNVTEAAQDTGFKNLSHFSSSFKEEFGYPPSELHQT